MSNHQRHYDARDGEFVDNETMALWKEADENQKAEIKRLRSDLKNFQDESNEVLRNQRNEIARFKVSYFNAIKALDNLLVIRGRDGDKWAKYNCVEDAMKIIAEAINGGHGLFVTCGLIDELEKLGLLKDKES